MLEYMYITNHPEVAQIIDGLGVDRVWIDLEVLGKEERQKNYDSVKSKHSIEDIEKIYPLLKKAKMQVRINPINETSEEEINHVISAGCDYIMLPMYKTVNEVKQFLKYVDGRAKTILLLETKEAMDILDDVLQLEGVDEMHIGLNDLHLSMHKQFMFELLADGTVEKICSTIKKSGIPYGFGGIAGLGKGMLPAEYVIAEHYRLGSTRAILSRSFCNTDDYTDYAEFEKNFKKELDSVKEYEHSLAKKSPDFFEQNQVNVKKGVQKIIEHMNK